MFDAEKLTDKEIEDLRKLSHLAKGDIITMTHLSGTGHPGGSMSSLDLYLTVFSCANLTGDEHGPGRGEPRPYVAGGLREPRTPRPYAHR